ncbi:hypothetical protein [Mucilaginibacter sp. L196]|uniref:hypothetical protein n=1 Tax=Mucilaginibacter sp. L196 TaxID=1641870 RepID=UPI00352F82DD
MAGAETYRVQTIGELHHIIGLPRPEHPLISVINLEIMKRSGKMPANRMFDFYSIALKRHCDGIRAAAV